MKKASTWAGIIGGITIASGIYNLAKFITDPTSLFWVNVATVVNEIIWLAFGIFLVYLFIRLRHKDDTQGLVTEIVPGSQEDVSKLERQRNRVFAFFLLVETMFSAEVWILNDYRAGLSIINIATIFDLVLHIAFVWIII